ncbi:MAG: GTP cyclohydrolase, FolE2/MptA family [Elusimicrobia bacterium]|nr:GTP cyclohydrolase, FolE2/MptA family [Elusimicrobiota bacterium]
MDAEKRFLVDVGMKDLPFPIRALSKADPEGQATVAVISIEARIMHEFEAGWIDRFIKIVHAHRDRIGTKTVRQNIGDYFKDLNATTVKVNFEYPFFVEKRTPVAKEKCLVRYNCAYSAKVPSLDQTAKVFFRIAVPCITTYPTSDAQKPGGLFGQLSVVTIETESKKDIYPEDLVELVDRHALTPLYSYLTEKDQEAVIRKIHSERRTSVVMVDGIKNELAADRSLNFYSVRCANFGMLHSYSTMIGTEKSWWVPFSGVDDEL